MLLAVPNFSEGRDAHRIERISGAFAGAGATLLDTHTDPIHNRTVLTLCGEDAALRVALEAGAAACIEQIDVFSDAGRHPRIGALDVCPLVWVRDDERPRARAAALAVAEAIAARGVPVFLYGDLASEEDRRERAHFRAGGPTRLAERMAAGELHPDLGPPTPHPTAGATLLTARAPLAAFNVELEAADPSVAGAVAARLRESGGGLPGVRAIGIDLGGGRVQVSTNVHDPLAVPLGQVVARVRELAAEHGARVVAGEVIGLVPAGALEGFPEDLPLPAFDPASHVIERRLGGR